VAAAILDPETIFQKVPPSHRQFPRLVPARLFARQGQQASQQRNSCKKHERKKKKKKAQQTRAPTA